MEKMRESPSFPHSRKGQEKNTKQGPGKKIPHNRGGEKGKTSPSRCDDPDPDRKKKGKKRCELEKRRPLFPPNRRGETSSPRRKPAHQ